MIFKYNIVKKNLKEISNYLKFMSEESSGHCYKTVKVPLKYCIKDPGINLPKIDQSVLTINSIVIHALQFMKLCILDGYDNYDRKIPDITPNFVKSCLKTVAQRNKTKADTTNKNMLHDLGKFYDKHYKDIAGEQKLPYTNILTVLEYMTETIITSYENNIKQHFVEYVERFVNVMFDKEKIINATVSEEERKQILQFLRNIKNDILKADKNDFSSSPNCHQWINYHKSLIFNKKEFKKDNIYYDLQVSPFDYLPGMIYMMKEIEKKGLSLSNVFPLRNDVVPHHIRIDTTTLIKTLLRKEHRKECGTQQDLLGAIKKNADKVWSLFFNTDLKCFKKKKYDFHHMIETDGVSCSIIFKRKDLKSSHKPKSCKPSAELYIDEVKDYTKLKEKKIVAIDPGKSDLIYCVDSASKEANIYRYTQDRRRRIGKSKRFNKLIIKMKKKEKIDEKKVQKLEDGLSKLNRKTLDFEKFKEYVREKNRVNVYLKKFYSREIFRKFKLDTYINIHRDEQNMINEFKEKYGNPDEVVICFGDFEQKKHMKFKEPTIGKGMRTLFRKNKFEVYLVDEFRTSCKCSICEGDCEKFLYRKNPRPYREGQNLVWGLLKCKTCGGVWNRDRNGASNIYKISENIINGKPRPDYLSRIQQISRLIK